MNRMYVALAVIFSTQAAVAQPGRSPLPGNKYQITDTERAACQNDAMFFCSTASADEDSLLACMKSARPKLTEGCRTVFETGLRRRHIPF